MFTMIVGDNSCQISMTTWSPIDRWIPKDQDSELRKNVDYTKTSDLKYMGEIHNGCLATSKYTVLGPACKLCFGPNRFGRCCTSPFMNFAHALIRTNYW
jgi:hypothetical protein